MLTSREVLKLGLILAVSFCLTAPEIFADGLDTIIGPPITAGFTCSPSPTTDQNVDDAGANCGDTTDHAYIGQVVDKAGGYTNICKLTYQLVAVGTIESLTWQVGDATLSGGDIVSFTPWETFNGVSSWSQTDYDITIDPPQSIAQGHALVIMSQQAGAAYIVVRRLDAGGTADFGNAVYRWTSAGVVNTTYADDDLRIAVYEGS